MPTIKDIPKVDRPREILLKKGPNALNKSELLAVFLGSGIKGKNVHQLSKQIIQKFGNNFLDITVHDLKKISGIGEVKALQIISAIALIKGYCEEKDQLNEVTIRNTADVLSLTNDLRSKKKEYIVCLYLNADNTLIKKEVISIGVLDKALIHPREIFYPATHLNASHVIIVHNHPSGNAATPSESDVKVVKRISKAGKIMGIAVIDFLIVSSKSHYSFHEKLNHDNTELDYVAEGSQGTLFDLLEEQRPAYKVNTINVSQKHEKGASKKEGYFTLQNRRYLGNKHKLLGFIEDIIIEKCGTISSFFDIFAGTGVVGAKFNSSKVKVISNDFLHANYYCINSFLATDHNIEDSIYKKIQYLNSLSSQEENYFSHNFGGTYFTKENAIKIGNIREEIESVAENESEKNILICSLIYAVDKVANTVGHYDAFRKTLDSMTKVRSILK